MMKSSYHCHPDKPAFPDTPLNAYANTPLMTVLKFPRM